MNDTKTPQDLPLAAEKTPEKNPEKNCHKALERNTALDTPCPTLMGLHTVRAVVDMLEQSTQLKELEYSWENCRVRVVKHSRYERAEVETSDFFIPPQELKAPRREAPLPPEEKAFPPIAISKENCVKSPMVGTVYLSPKPGDPPFITLDSVVEEGQTLLIIEAMKTMNSIKAPKSGRIRAILIDNEDPVEFGQPLVHME